MRRNIINNYRLTPSQIETFKKIFPYTRNAQLQIKFGLTLNEISRLRQKFELKKNKRVYVLTPKQIDNLKNDFFRYKNYELLDRYKITKSQLNWIRKNEGIRKRI